MTFREDESRIRRGNAPHNIGVIRHVAMNLLKREKTKLSYRKKRILAALNDDFRDKLLIVQWSYLRPPCDRTPESSPFRSAPPDSSVTPHNEIIRSRACAREIRD